VPMVYPITEKTVFIQSLLIMLCLMIFLKSTMK